METRYKNWLFAILTLFIPYTEISGATPHLTLMPIGGAFTAPVYFTGAKDGSGRQFVVEQAGRILLVGPRATVFLDIRNRVASGGERGLLGLAFHPQYANNGRFFVNYTRQPDGATVIAEYHVTSDPNAADSRSERVLLVIPQPYVNHNGGMVEFGPDGWLYTGMGDGGSGNDPENRAQNPNELLGKILRINVESTRVEIFAMGLRNPWRFSFDRVTGELWVGDVGQSAREEVDVVRQGGNYGWRVYEGTFCTGSGPALCDPASFIPPVTEYVNGAGGRCSITGGYVYRGAAATFPYGGYIFGDYCSGEIFMWKDGVQSVVADTSLNISSFGEDASGELYVVGHGGSIFKMMNADALTTSELDFTIDDDRGISRTAGEGVSAISTGYARIRVPAGDPGGLAIYGLRRAGVLVSETAVPISHPVESGRIYAEAGMDSDVAIAITNPNPEAVTISFYFTDTTGKDFSPGTTVIPANEQIARFVRESPFNASMTFRGTMTFTASAPVVAVAMRGFVNERSEFLFTNEPVSPLGATSSEVVFPHFAVGGGWEPVFLLVNPTDGPISGALQFSTAVTLDGQNGSNFPYAIPARSSRRLAVNGAVQTKTVGYVRIIPAANTATPSATELLRFRSNGVVVTESSTPAVHGGSAFRTYAQMGGTVRTGLAVVNTGAAAASVELRLVPFDGGPSYLATISVETGQRCLYLDEINEFTNLPPFEGLLDIMSSTTVNVTVARGRTNERGDFLMTSMTSADENGSASSSELAFPFFVVGNGYETQFVLFDERSTQTKSGAMFFINERGEAQALTLR